MKKFKNIVLIVDSRKYNEKIITTTSMFELFVLSWLIRLSCMRYIMSFVVAEGAGFLEFLNLHIWFGDDRVFYCHICCFLEFSFVTVFLLVDDLISSPLYSVVLWPSTICYPNFEVSYLWMPALYSFIQTSYLLKLKDLPTVVVQRVACVPYWFLIHLSFLEHSFR